MKRPRQKCAIGPLLFCVSPHLSVCVSLPIQCGPRHSIRNVVRQGGVPAVCYLTDGPARGFVCIVSGVGKMRREAGAPYREWRVSTQQQSMMESPRHACGRCGQQFSTKYSLDRHKKEDSMQPHRPCPMQRYSRPIAGPRGA